MNKKFSTLMVAALLTAWGGTNRMYAQEPGGDATATETPASVCDFAGESIALAGATFEDDETLDPEKYYFVQDAEGNFLYLDNSTKAFQARLVEEGTVTASLEDIDKALWQIKTQISNDGGVVRFYLVNKGTGLFFSYDPANAVTSEKPDATAASKYLGGAYPYWKWFASKYNKAGQFGTEAGLSVVHSAADYTMVLMADDDNVLYSYKYSEKEEEAPDEAISLKVVKAGAYVMKAADLNTKATKDGLKYMQLDFGEKANQNNIFATKLQAQGLNRASSATAGEGFLYRIDNSEGYANGWLTGMDNDYLILNTLENDELSNKYVHVDTSYFASTGASHKLYNNIAVTKNAASFVEDVDQCFEQIASGLPLDAFRFKFVKNLETDKIWVRALVEAVEMEEPAETYYNNSDAKRVTFWNYASTVTSGNSQWSAIEKGLAEQVKNGTGTNLVLSHCTLQDETKKVVTFYECDADKTKNRVNLLASDASSKDYKSLAEGIYKVYVKTVTADNYKKYVGLYAANSLCGENKYAEVVKQDVEHMPAYQWVVTKVVKNGEMAAISPIKVQNREFNSDFMGEAIHQLVKVDGLAANEYLCDGKVFVFELIDPATTLGYFNEDTEEDVANIKSYNLTYLSGLAGEGATLAVGLDKEEKDIVLTVGKEAVSFNLHPVKKEMEYGITDDLERAVYTLEVEESGVLTDQAKRYVMAEAYGASVKYVLTEEENASEFMLKEQNCVDGTHYYALIEVAYDKETKTYSQAYKAGVDDVTAQLIQECLCCDEESGKDCRISSFALTVDDTPLYRRLGETNPADEFEDMKINIGKIYRTNSTEREYLYEDVNSVYAGGKGINFLGVEGKGDNKDAGLTIDTAYVRYETSMPQYMFVMEAVRHEAGKECPFDPYHNSDEYLAAHPEGCPHAVPTQAYTTGRYLINFADSVNLSENARDYQWNQKYTRLGFVDAKHIGDTLIIMRDGQPGTEAADSIFLGDNKHNMPTLTLNANPSKNSKGDSIHAAHEYGIKNAVFALRLVNTDACDFLIETAGNKKIPTENQAWVAIKNGVPVVAEYATYTDAIADAEIFNIEKTDKAATDNEEVTVSEVTIIAGNGQLTIAGAAGKKVVISNILGQVVANTVVSSDNATIAAPQGIVVVAVEGEEAVKAIVK
ncbi:DUF6383 domain-containing protein [Parabacteroides johnsonii]|jgi:hypothetical protein|uniref:DUF6383 domain-containing protein n=1 Tax=Parabacteroides johnsonii TaxID=387661 RepID=A0A9Q5SR54_9BACT|nr:DUF6383 domain-containing protein [Parabacteroides johnsonii]OUO04894.1 hypothetical protein B5F96_10910 [Parabacteroides johnsonii]